MNFKREACVLFARVDHQIGENRETDRIGMDSMAICKGCEGALPCTRVYLQI